MNRISILAAFFLATTGCVGTDVGNPQDGDVEQGPDELRFTVDNHAPSSPQALVHLGVTLTSAWIVVERVTLEACATENEYVLEGPFELDLLSDVAEHIGIPRGEEADYCRVKIDFAANKSPDSGPDELVGAWFFAEGALEDGRPFSIRSLNRASLNFVGPSEPIQLDSPQGLGLLTNLPFVRWIADGNLDAVEADEIYLDDISAGPLYGNFKREFSTQARLFRDRDKNGKVDEDDTPIGIPE